ncbi:MAG: glycosyltransferase family 2 protein [Lachnospiraceae bacterium]|nr:glycosyltransferase family 2 protein [Lachnospiraceae bacterium]
MKKVSILIPCYNEEENVREIAQAVEEQFTNELPDYNYEIIFIDNDSKDRTRDYLRVMAATDPHIKAILNTRNFGQFNSPYYGILQAHGDCVITIACDFQDPVEMIPKFVHAWEEGYKVVIGQKTKSDESKLVYGLRSLYYRMVRRFSDVPQIDQFTGFGLYDQEFVALMRTLDDPIPFLRGVVAEMGYKYKAIEYTQPKRRAGHTSNNFYRLYDGMMLSFTSYTKIGLRIASFIGYIGAFISLGIGIYYLVRKLIDWYGYPAGMAPLIILVGVLGSLQLIFIGLMGEYILSINQRLMKRPLVVEEERLGNWEDDGKEEETGQ